MITTLNFGLSTRSSVWLVLVTGENCTVLLILSPSRIGFLGSPSHYDDPPYGVLSSPVKRLVSCRDKSRNGPITYKVFAKRRRLRGSWIYRCASVRRRGCYLYHGHEDLN